MGAQANLFDDLHRRPKEIHHPNDFVLVEIVHGVESGLRVIAQVAQDFTHVGPVFLFDVSVVVFFVRPPSGELDLSLIAERLEVVVEVLGQPLSDSMLSEFEGQSLFKRLHGNDHIALASTHYGSSCGPGEKNSVRLSECTNSPFSELPEWEARSVSVSLEW